MAPAALSGAVAGWWCSVDSALMGVFAAVVLQVDGQPAGTVSRRRGLQVSVPAGVHQLVATARRIGSPPLSVSVDLDQRRTFIVVAEGPIGGGANPNEVLAIVETDPTGARLPRGSSTPLRSNRMRFRGLWAGLGWVIVAVGANALIAATLHGAARQTTLLVVNLILIAVVVAIAIGISLHGTRTARRQSDSGRPR